MGISFRAASRLLSCCLLMLFSASVFAGIDRYQLHSPLTENNDQDTLIQGVVRWMGKILPTDRNSELGFRWIETIDVVDDPSQSWEVEQQSLREMRGDRQRIVGPGGMFRRFENASPASRSPSASGGVPAAASGNLSLKAVIPDGMAVPAQQITWIVRPVQGGRERSLQGLSLQLSLPTGSYEVRLRIGTYEESRIIRLERGGSQVASVFSANIGRLQASSKTAANWEVFLLQGGSPARRIMGRNGSTQISGILPAGEYQVVAGINNARQVQKVRIGKGKTSVARISLPTGKVNLVATYQNAPALRPVNWTVYRLDGGRQQVAAPRRHSATITVPPGRYEVVANLDGRERRREFTVMDGTRNSIVLAMD